MARKGTVSDGTEATTQVNIADFQRTRDSSSAATICSDNHVNNACSTIVQQQTKIPPTLTLIPNMMSSPLHPPSLSPCPCPAEPMPSFTTRSNYTHLSPSPIYHTFICSTRVLVQHITRLHKNFSAVAQFITETTEDDLIPDDCVYDQVIVALATLQSSVQDLSRAYIKHANTVLGPGAGGALDSNLTSILTGSGLLTGPSRNQTDVAVPAEDGAGEGKKKRKRAKHDPNAPKRALTPYFLFMQTARSQIARELGENAKPKEVADEGTRRWSVMPPEDKHVWEAAYQTNLAAYRVRMAAYRANQPVPTMEEALKLVEAGKAPTQAQVDAIAAAHGTVDEDEDEEETPEPVKEPEPPKAAKRQKKSAAAEEVKPVAKSPEKKSKKSKKEATPPPPAPVAAAKSSEKKSKKSKKAA